MNIEDAKLEIKRLQARLDRLEAFVREVAGLHIGLTSWHNLSKRAEELLEDK